MSKCKQTELIPGENAKAIVVRRASRGGDRYYWPTRLYIVLVPTDEKGEPVTPTRITDRLKHRRFELNSRARRRCARMEAFLQSTAYAVNNKMLSWENAMGMIRDTWQFARDGVNPD